MSQALLENWFCEHSTVKEQSTSAGELSSVTEFCPSLFLELLLT